LPIAQTQIRQLNAEQLHPFRELTFEDWLLAVDCSGALHSYLTAIRSNFDSLMQIVKTYVSMIPAGLRTLDDQLFEDLGVHDVSNRVLFLSWFARELGATAISSGRTGDMPKRSRFVGDAELRCLDFGAWLALLDTRGTLCGYASVLEERYDTVLQLVRTCSLPAISAKVFDLGFFNDTLITDRQHQAMFLRWFAEARAVSVPPNCGWASPTRATAPEGARLDCGSLLNLRSMSFACWLQDVDPSGTVLGYVAILEESYDTVPQVVRTYASPNGSKSMLDEQFFEDMAVSVEHEALFRAWFDRQG